MIPTIIKGEIYKNKRWIFNFNRDFDNSSDKRMYIIEKIDTFFVRRCQGHKKEQRWFSVIIEKFKIELIKIDSLENPSKKLEKFTFENSSEKIDFLHILAGYVRSIQSIIKFSKLLVISDYKLGAVCGDYKYSADYFYQ